MNNIYEVFALGNTDLLVDSKIFYEILVSSTQEEKEKLQETAIRKMGVLDNKNNCQNLLIKTAKKLKDINFKINHPGKFGRGQICSQELKDSFQFMYNEFANLLLKAELENKAHSNSSYNKNFYSQSLNKEFACLFGAVFFLMAMDEHTPKSIYDKLLENRDLVIASVDILKKNYWLNVKLEKLEDFKYSWTLISPNDFFNASKEIFEKVNEATLNYNKSLENKNLEKSMLDLQRRYKRELGLGFLYLYAFKKNVEKLSNVGGDINLLDSLIQTNFFKRYAFTPVILSEIKEIAKLYSKVCPRGETLFPVANSHNKYLDNFQFIFNLYSKEVFEKTDVLNMLAQKNRNKLLDESFREIFFQEKNKINSDSQINVSKVHWTQNTNFEDIKNTFNIQNCPLSAKDWGIIAFATRNISNSKEAIKYLNEKQFKDDAATVSRPQTEVKIRPRTKF